MTYRLGIDVGTSSTSWAVIAGMPDRTPDTGTVPSMVTLVHRDDVHVARDFVQLVGRSEPIIVGGTPYGAEALLSRLVSGVLGVVRERQGEEPAAVVLVHDDALDPYRSGLYVEALRLAGVTSAAAFVIARREAQAVAPGVAPAVGAAGVGWQRVPAPIDDDGHGGGAVVLGTGVTGAAVIATTLGDAVEGGVGLPGAAGPQGSLLANAGPAGSPLGTSGPAGTSLPPPGGAVGAPVSGPPAPLGTPLAPGANAPPPLVGPAAPAQVQSTSTPSPSATPPPTGSDATGSPGPTHGHPPDGRLPEPVVRPDRPELAPEGFTWWRRWWLFPVVFVVLLLIAVPLVFVMGRPGDTSRSVIAASTTVPRTTTTIARPVPSVLAPSSVLTSLPATSAPATSAMTTTTTTTATLTTTTAPPSTVGRAVPRTTAPPAVVPMAAPTVPSTVATTVAPPTTVPPTAPPNVAPVLAGLTSSLGTMPTCAPGSNVSTINVDVSDLSGVASVAVTYSYAVDKSTSTSGTLELGGPSSGGRWSGTFTMTVFTSFGSTPISLVAVATDTQGLTAQIGATPMVAVAPPIC